MDGTRGSLGSTGGADEAPVPIGEVAKAGETARPLELLRAAVRLYSGVADSKPWPVDGEPTLRRSR
jgi:hypothetical protein